MKDIEITEKMAEINTDQFRGMGGNQEWMTRKGLERLIEFKKEVPEKYHEEITHIGRHFYSVLLTYQSKLMEKKVKTNKNIIVRILRCIFRIIKFCIFKPKKNPCEEFPGIPIETVLPDRSERIETKKKPTVVKLKTKSGKVNKVKGVKVTKGKRNAKKKLKNLKGKKKN